jgi:myo-inositol-1(or 4)-monophosphatase
MGISMSGLPLARSGKICQDVAIEAAEMAGEMLLEGLKSGKKVTQKSRGNLVTDIDILVEENVIRFLRAEYPEFHILSEESGSSLSSVQGYTWVIDPLDGTNNYVFGVPFFCVNVALVKEREVLIGVTYDPVRKELFLAEKGCGAFLNGAKIQTSVESSLGKSLVGLDLGYEEQRGRELLSVASELWWRVHCLRLIGSASLGLAYVACGRFNLYVHRYLYPWDIASGLVLVAEAGGRVVDWRGRPADIFSREIVAGNEKLCQQFISQYGEGGGG